MTDSDVSKQTGLSLRKGIYYVRVVVPLDLQVAYGGRTTISRTLGTRDLREAKLRATERRAEFLREFNDKRRGLSPQPVAVITPELGATLVAGTGPVTYPGSIGRAIPVANLLTGAQATQRVAYVDANPLNLRLANLTVETVAVTSSPSPAPYPPHAAAPGSAPTPSRPWFNDDPARPAGA